MSDKDNKNPKEIEEVDIEQLEVEVLIIPKFPIAMGGPAQFLIKRGWPCKVESNVTKAIEYIMKHKPDFVLVSVNHPHHNVAKLPLILGRTLDVTCIAFTELADAKSASALNGAKVAHRITGHPSGPNIHRAIHKILSDTYNPDAALPDSGGKIVEDGGNIIRFKAEKKSNTYGFSVSAQTGVKKGGAKNSGSSEEDLANPNHRRRLKDLKAGISRAEAGAKKKAEGLDADKLIEMLDKGEEPTGNGNFIDPGLQDEKGENIVQQGGRKKKDKGYILETGEMRKGNAVIAGPDDEKGPAHIKGEGKDSKELSAKIDGVEDGNTRVSGEEDSALSGRVTGEEPEKEPMIMGGSSPDRGSIVDQGNGRGKGAVLTGAEREFSQNVKKALSDIGKTGGQSIAPTNMLTKQIGVIEVDSDALHGYLVFVRIDGDPLSMKFLELIKTDLAKQLGGRGIREAMGLCYIVDVDEVDILKFCEEKCIFNFSVDSDYGNIMGGFLTTSGRLCPIEAMPGGKMSRIQNSEISEDIAVAFDAYLYFKKSNRYLKYMKSGRKFLDRQVDRIRKNRLALHIRNNEVLQYREYVAKRFVSTRIKEYIGRKAKDKDKGKAS